MLEFRQLRYYVTIVEAGSLTRAATVLHIAQPALSQQMAGLEQAVGMRLLTRSVRGVVPTDAGWAVYRHAQTLLKLEAQTRDIAKGAVGMVSGRVRLGLPSSIAMILAAPLLEWVQEQLPHVLLELYESPSAYLAAQLLDERMDLSLLVDSQPSTALASQPVVDESLYFVRAAAGKARRRGPPVSLAEIADTPMILTTRATTLRQLVDAAFDGAGIAPAVRAEASSIQTLLTVVAQGSLATLIPFSALSWHPATRPLERRLIAPGIYRRTTLAWSRSASLTPAAQAVRDAIAAVMVRLVEDGTWEGAQLCTGPR